MKRTIVLSACLLAGMSSVAGAQDHRWEFGATGGYTLSDGVSGQAILAGDGNIYDTIGPKDSASFGLSLGYFVNETTEVSFEFNRQASTLEVSGTRTREIGDMNVDGYHGVFTYHFGESDAAVRPYLSLGLGATTISNISFIDVSGRAREINGETRFAGNLGLGLKMYPNNGKFGLKLGAKWTPTYIKSDPGGYWCDPYWGCYVVGNAQYMNQFEFAGGVSLRF